MKLKVILHVVYSDQQIGYLVVEGGLLCFMLGFLVLPANSAVEISM